MAFENLNSLETLSIQNNKLSRIPEEVMEPIIDTLRVVDIMGESDVCHCFVVHLSWLFWASPSNTDNPSPSYWVINSWKRIYHVSSSSRCLLCFAAHDFPISATRRFYNSPQYNAGSLIECLCSMPNTFSPEKRDRRRHMNLLKIQLSLRSPCCRVENWMKPNHPSVDEFRKGNFLCGTGKLLREKTKRI